MSQTLPIAGREHSCAAPQPRMPKMVAWLQGITLAWMLIECAVSLYAAHSAHSAALLAFGADSLVELLSASVALLSFFPSIRISKSQASRWAGLLLFVLAGVVVITTGLSLRYGIRPEASCVGIGITVAALVVMPVLAWLKRKTARTTNNRALAADAVQSATCAYLAGITLVGLGVNAAFRIHWIDWVAALAATPILIIEGRKAMRGESCGYC